MKSMKQAVQKGFTLVELLIVVIIIAILASILVPQFSSSTDDAKVAALQGTLANVRSALDLYYQQHGHFPAAAGSPATPAACTGTGGTDGTATETFTSQLTLYTKANGEACSKQDAGFDFGPYLKGDLPENPITNVATLVVLTGAAAGDLNMTADGAGGGWKYDTLTGKFIANDTPFEDL